MRLLTAIAIVLVTANARVQGQCVQVQFSGEASQSHKYIQQLDEYLQVNVFPLHFEPDPRWAWFEISVAPRDGVFVFSLGDANWLLDVTDFWSAFIGGPNSDLDSSLQYRARYFVFPIAAGDKKRAREAASLITSANTPEATKRAMAALMAVPLAHLQFEITDYRLDDRLPPMGVQWVKFDIRLTFPPDFRLSGDTPFAVVSCPLIPTQLVENMRNPERYQYILPFDNAPRQ
jgi:hypothetical protein